MTFKATPPYLRLAEAAGLERRDATKPGLQSPRTLLISKDVSAIIDGATSGFPSAEAAITNDIFIAGQMVSITRERGRKARLEKLEGVDDVWLLAYRKPRPGWRLLGRFMEQDVFVGLSLKPRSWLGRFSGAYVEEANEVIRIWEDIFPGIDPVRSTNLDDYVGGLKWDLDNDG